MSTEAVAAPAAPASLRSRFRTGIAYNTIGAVFNQGSTFAVNIIVANLLGRQVFGEYAMTQSTLATLSLVAQLAVGYTATKYVAEFRSTDPQRAGRILGMLMVFSATVAGVAALALLGLSGWLAESMLKAPSLGPVLAVGSGVLLFAVLNGLLMGALVGFEGYRSLATALVWSGIVYLAVCSGLAWQAGLNGAVVGLAISGFVQFVLLGAALLRQCSVQGIRIRYAGMRQERRILLKFALPAALAGFTTMPAIWLAGTFLVRQPDGYSQMGLYGASFSLMTASLFLPNIVNSVGMALINHHKGTGRDSEYRRTFWMNLAVSTTIVIFATCVLAVFGRDILRIFGKDFRDGYTVLVILLLATIVQCVAGAMYQVIQSQARMWLSFLAVALPRDLLLVLLAYLLIPAHGAIGLAAAYTAAWTVALIAIAFIVLRTGVRPVA
jgi:O-antigen/teichoic acid export membrane protein